MSAFLAHPATALVLALASLGLGLGVLWLAGDGLVRSAAAIARRMGVSAMTIGLTLVAFGSSAPEAFVIASAALTGEHALAVGSVMGSNIANSLLILGIPALFLAIPCAAPLTRRAAIAAALAAVVIVLASWSWGAIPRLFGIALIGTIALYAIYVTRVGRRFPEPPDANNAPVKPGTKHALGEVALLLGCFVALPAGSVMVVFGAKTLALYFGASEAFVGLSVVALGTSFPELAIAIAAAIQRLPKLLMGSILGSNAFNLLFIIGIGGVLAPEGALAMPWTTHAPSLIMTLAAMVGLAVLVMLRRPLSRGVGVAMLAVYAGYMGFEFLR